MYLGIDVGGTKAAAVLVDAQGRVSARHVQSSVSADYGALLTTIVMAAQQLMELAGVSEVEGVGLALAGNVSADRSRVVTSPHLPLNGEPIRADIEAALGIAVLVENDGNAAAWAESQLGGQAHRQNLAFVSVGTGLGGGLIVDGALYRGGHGFAGEPGHVPIVPDGLPCPCGGRGCWEQYASGTALQRAFVNRGGSAQIAGDSITAAARAGDEAAVAAFHEIAEWLGFGLAGLVAHLDPSVIVLGGGVLDASDIVLEPTRASLRRHLGWGGRREPPPVVAARLGNDAGAIGAAVLAGVPSFR